LKKYATRSRPSMVWLFVASGHLLLFILLSAPTATQSANPTPAPTMSNVPSGCDMLNGQTWTTTDSWAMQITFFEGMSSGGLDYGHFSSSYGNGKFYFGAGSTAYCGYARSGYIYLNCYTGTPYSYVAQQYACYYYIYVYNSSLCYGCGAGSIYSSPTRVPTTSPTNPTVAPTISPTSRSPTVSPTNPTVIPTTKPTVTPTRYPTRPTPRPTAAPTLGNVPSGCDMLNGQTWTTTDSWAMQITFFEGMSSGGLDYGHFSSSYGNGKFYFGAGSTAYCGYARSGYIYLNCYTGTPYSYVAQQYACYYYIYVYNSSLCYGCGAGSIYSSPTRVPTTAPTNPTVAPTISPTSRSPTVSPTKPTVTPTSSPTAVPTRSPTKPTLTPTHSPTNPTARPTAAPTMSSLPAGCDMLYGQTWTTTDSWAMQITFFEGMSSGGLDYGHFSSSYGNGQFYFGAGSTAYCGYARSGYIYLNCYTGTPYSYVAQQYACYYYIYVYNSSLCYGCGAGSIYSSPTRVPTTAPTNPTVAPTISPTSRSPTVSPTKPTVTPTSSPTTVATRYPTRPTPRPTAAPTMSSLPAGCDMLK
jgi:hypothetical protein